MKIRSVLVFALSAALIVLGAMLPRLVGDRQDAENENRVQFASVNEVQLEFEESGMTMREKLAVTCQYSEVVDIPEQLAALTREKARGIVEQTLEQYRDAGLMLEEISLDVPWVSVYLQPTLLYGNGDSEQSCVFWNATVTWGEAEWACNLLLDDQTGKVCRIGFTNYVEENTIYPDMEDAFYQFCDLYLTGLGEEFFEYDSRQLAENARKPADGSYMAAEVAWINESGSGSCRLTLFMRTNGFDTYAQY